MTLKPPTNVKKPCIHCGQIITTSEMNDEPVCWDCAIPEPEETPQ